MEAVMARLKEIEDTVERRQKLERRPGPAASTTATGSYDGGASGTGAKQTRRPPRKTDGGPQFGKGTSRVDGTPQNGKGAEKGGGAAPK
jgi:hypothetical protein